MVITLDKLQKIRRKYNSKKIVLIGGSFDILHVGHLSFLKKAKSFGDILCIAISSDQRVRERKGSGRPINPALDRVRMIDSLKLVDYSVITPYKVTNVMFPTFGIIEQLKPDSFVTSDIRWLSYKKDIRNVSERTNLEILNISNRKIKSTTNIINKVIKQNIQPE
jgi:rfaE bifunctional protein nucleotidyltransferase chain/domain